MSDQPQPSAWFLDPRAELTDEEERDLDAIWSQISAQTIAAADTETARPPAPRRTWTPTTKPPRPDTTETR